MRQYKRALITGAANGLGKAFVDRLLADGTEIFALDRAKIDGYSQSNTLNRIELNLIHLNSVNALVSDLKNQAPFDLIIHSAGISATGNFEEISPDAYHNLIKLNVEVPIQITAHMLKQNMFAKASNLVFISSLSHAVGYPGASVYAASKDAIAIYAKSIRKSCLKEGIYISTVFPGPLRTEHAARHAPKGAKEDRRMPPDVAAKLILRDVARKNTHIFPGFAAKASAFAGRLSPNLMTRLMRHVIFEKLDRAIW